MKLIILTSPVCKMEYSDMLCLHVSCLFTFVVLLMSGGVQAQGNITYGGVPVIKGFTNKPLILSVATPISALLSANHSIDNKSKNSAIQFDDVSSVIDFTYQSNNSEGLSGAVWFDYNNDGLMDVFLTNDIGHSNGLFRNDGDGKFTEVSAVAGLQNDLGSTGVVAGDIDNDGFEDLFVSGAGEMFTPGPASPVKLYHNNGNGSFTDISSTSGIVGSATNMNAAFADINNDGYIDLFIAAPGSMSHQRQDLSKLYLNNGNRTFTDITFSSGVITPFGGCAASFTDYDNDGDQDLLVGFCNDIHNIPHPIHLFRNNGNLTFKDVANEAGINALGGWMGITVADYDNDGDQDFFATNLGHLPPFGDFYPVLYRNNGDGTFKDVAQKAGVRTLIWGWGASFADFNNDGYSDIFYTGSFPFMPFNIDGSRANPGFLLINSRDKTFIDRSAWLNRSFADEFTSGVAIGDYDGNGFLDLLVTSGATSTTGQLVGPRVDSHPVLLKNLGDENGWITIRALGTVSNRDAIGTKIVVHAGGLTQTKEIRAGSSFNSSDSLWLTFGLGHQKHANSIEVLWPSGKVERFGKLRGKRMITIQEGQGIIDFDSRHEGITLQ